MIIVNNNIHPENSLYYAGALILQIFQEEKSSAIDFILLFEKINNKINIHNKRKKYNIRKKLPFINYILALDWLFVIGVISYHKEGTIEYVVA